jgi:hypothetical protein
VPEAALDTMADDGVADAAAHHEADERRARVVVGEHVHHEGALPTTTS